MPDAAVNIHAVLLAGGSGTRLWPVSRELFPKQLVSFFGTDSLVQATIKRLSPLLETEKVRIVCGAEHYYEIARHMEDIGVTAAGKIIREPVGRNTAPAILLAVLTILKEEKDAVVCVFPADHVIKDIDRFHRKLEAAIELAHSGHIITFGIQPNFPETGYGYIEGADRVSPDALGIKRFVEKPDKTTARKYIEAGNFFWNSGMFAFKASVIVEEYNKFQPALLSRLEGIVSGLAPVTLEDYQQLPNISFDHAIMESTQKGVVLPSDFGWSDIGSWKSLYDFLPKDTQHNVTAGDVIVKDTQNCFIMGHERLIATNHLRNMVVVETPDSVFVSDMDRSRDVKEIVTQLKESGRREYHTHRLVYHPWGTLTLLEQREGYRVDRMVIYPNSKFKVERLAAATKQMICVCGVVGITSEKGDISLKAGQTAVVSPNEIVQMNNKGKENACIIQVQMEKGK
ncbi:MAG: mannose-1-phosphate guanylyltransferase/mannose-6-phosphate isomerase [Desulfobacterales bacterium]|nr:mannose-1-phosphate guanylyltransferase/mannose-6-phosphate isomerase [Desulfobacterales bacterium]